MKSSRQKRERLVKAINAGIAQRGFYIVPSPEVIPGCCGERSEKLQFVRQFADKHGWHFTVHNENGWILFTTDSTEPIPEVQNDLGLLVELIRGRRTIWDYAEKPAEA